MLPRTTEMGGAPAGRTHEPSWRGHVSVVSDDDSFWLERCVSGSACSCPCEEGRAE